MAPLGDLHHADSVPDRLGPAGDNIIIIIIKYSDNTI